MKMHTSDREVTTSVGESVAFSISNAGKVMGMLMGKLYSKVEESITREIWSNALDSHIQAGCPERPFDVVFPTRMHPVFKVRDYGVSLTHDQMMRMYSDLGKSTKEETNEQVGTWGLGSKSPTAYTDTFSVAAVLEGRKRFYSIVVGSDSIPTINLMGETDTDEERGIEVSFPVSLKDIEAFRKASKRVAHGFAIKPNVAESPDFTGWDELAVHTEGDGWKLLKNSLELYNNQTYAQMGCVLYPIDAAMIAEAYEGAQNVLSENFIIDCPIGSLGVNPSRESLSYSANEPTTQTIVAAVKAIEAELIARTEKEYAACASFWDACVLYNEQRSNHPSQIVRQLLNNGRITWRGHKLKSYIKDRCRYNDYNSLDARKLSLRAIRFSKDHNTRGGYRDQNEVTVFPDSTTYFVVEDCSGEEGTRIKHVAARLKRWASENTVRNLIWIRYAGGKAASEEMITLLETFDGATFLDLESLPRPELDYARARQPVRVRIMSDDDFTRMTHFNENDFEEGGIFVPLKHMEAQIPTGCYNPFRLRTALVKAQFLDEDTVVYGAPKSLLSKFSGEQWTNLYDFAEEQYEAKTHNVDFSLQTGVQRVMNDDFLLYCYDNLVVDRLAEKSPAVQLSTFIKEVKKVDRHKLDGYVSVANALGITPATQTEHAYIKECATHKETMKKTYPLLTVLKSHVMSNHSIADEVTDYINTCDRANSANHNTGEIK